jgi:hypothetical protein
MRFFGSLDSIHGVDAAALTGAGAGASAAAGRSVVTGVAAGAGDDFFALFFEGFALIGNAS